jgi:hypothetical protein
MCSEQNPIGVPRTVELHRRPVTGSRKFPGTGGVHHSGAVKRVPLVSRDDRDPMPAIRPVAISPDRPRKPVGDIAREFSEDRSVGCAGDIRTPEQLIGHIERVHHAIDLAIRAVGQARAEYFRGRVDPLRALRRSR